MRQPREVSIETLALCNAACTFCPYPTLDRQGVKMSDELIERLIVEMSSWAVPFFVAPFKVNEPFLDVRLPDICREIVSRCQTAKLRLFTNGAPLTDRNIDWVAELPRSRIEHLWISLNSTDPDEYRKLMAIDMDRTFKRLFALHKRVASREFKHQVMVSRVMSDEPKENVRFLQDVGRLWPLFHARLIKRDGWLGYVHPSSPKIPQAPCIRWWDLSIMATGKVALCCMDGAGEFSIGDVSQDSMLAVYNQPMLLKRRQSASNRHGIEPCQRCTY